MNGETAVLSAEELTKKFGTNVAVSKVSLNILSGEIVALVGCNGSGKSTLLKMIYGNLIPDSGCVKLNGARLQPGSPNGARSYGIEMVFQDKDEESKFCPGMTVIENLFLGREPVSNLGFIQSRRMQERAKQIGERYKLSFHLDAKFGRLSGGQQKAVAIGRALLSEPRFLLLDEPTASLGVTERGFVHGAMDDLRQSGVGIVFCSHSLDEVMRVADRVVAIRSGELIADESVAGAAEADVALLMSK